MKWDLDLRITFSGKVARRGAKTQFPEAVLKYAETSSLYIKSQSQQSSFFVTDFGVGAYKLSYSFTNRRTSVPLIFTK